MRLSALSPLPLRRIGRGHVPRQERLGWLAAIVADERGDGHPPGRGLEEIVLVVIKPRTCGRVMVGGPETSTGDSSPNQTPKANASSPGSPVTDP